MGFFDLFKKKKKVEEKKDFINEEIEEDYEVSELDKDGNYVIVNKKGGCNNVL